MTVWFLEFDIVKMFDKINHRKLITILRSHFNDKNVLNVIREMLKVNYISLVGLSDSNLEQKLGSPQGSIISPLLANIYMDPFDK
jgi:retron-type reverse transcriptase